MVVVEQDPVTYTTISRKVIVSGVCGGDGMMKHSFTSKPLQQVIADHWATAPRIEIPQTSRICIIPVSDDDDDEEDLRISEEARKKAEQHGGISSIRDKTQSDSGHVSYTVLWKDGTETKVRIGLETLLSMRPITNARVEIIGELQDHTRNRSCSFGTC